MLGGHRLCLDYTRYSRVGEVAAEARRTFTLTYRSWPEFGQSVRFLQAVWGLPYSNGRQGCSELFQNAFFVVRTSVDLMFIVRF